MAGASCRKCSVVKWGVATDPPYVAETSPLSKVKCFTLHWPAGSRVIAIMVTVLIYCFTDLYLDIAVKEEWDVKD